MPKTISGEVAAGQREEGVSKRSARLDLFGFVPFRLNRLAAEVSSALSVEYATRYGLDIPEWRVLATLGFRHDACSAQYIAQCTRTHKSTISRAVVHDDLVFTVAVAPDPVSSSMYEQSAKALARIDESLTLCGTDKSKILSAIVYITDIKRKGEMNRAWDEWVDTKNPPMRACLGVDLEPPHIVEIVVTAVK